MNFECNLVLDKTQTSFASLCAFGHYLSREKALEPLQRVEVPQKTVTHSPQEKLIDSVIGMLAGCEALYEINTKVRPDLPLRRAFGREEVGPADHSVIQQTFNAFDKRSVGQLREALEEIHRRYSKIYSHDFEEELLVIEVDLTGLTASKASEGSTKGYFAGKTNSTGRQLARVIAPQYLEIIFEKLYTGDTNSSEVLKEVLKESERLLGLEDDKYRRQRTLIRIDGGFGTDENLNWLCWRGYQFIAKGYSGGRAKKVARSVPEEDWREGPTLGQLLGRPKEPHRYARRTRTVARRWQDKKGKVHQDLLITTQDELSNEQIAKLYDRRGAMEVDIKGDKRGLGLEKRKKKRFDAQETLVLLAQLAHNLATWFKEWFLAGTEAGRLGMERLVREVFRMPGRVEQVGWCRSTASSSKVRLELPHLHPWAKAVAKGIKARLPQSRSWAFWREI